MSERKSGFVDIDELQKQVDWETIWRFYELDPGEVHRTAREIRTRCFLNCGRTEETGTRVVSFDTTAPRWRCHQSGCGKGGNMVSLCGLIKYGPEGLRPRGAQFRAIRDDLRAMLSGVGGPGEQQRQGKEEESVEETPRNRPLAESENERARALVNLDGKFLVAPDERMNRYGAAYMRRRPYLTPEACRKWRCGYLPYDGGGDRSGGTMRGKFVYPMLDEEGQVLTWFGRDTQYEEKHRRWIAGGREGREPEKFQFVKGFHRGLELFGQHRIRGEEAREKIHAAGVLVLVEEPHAVIALEALGVPALAMCGNVVTIEQARLATAYARRTAVPVGLMLENTPEGEQAAKVSLAVLAERGPVQLMWSSRTDGGRFRGWEADQVAAAPDAWETIQKRLSGVE